ncbi:MAG: ABC-2 family transporter protein [Patescibacteria group bacterium]
MIPIQFMPAWLQETVSLLPLKYLYAAPIGIFTDTFKMNTTDWIYYLSSIGALYFLSQFIWKKAIRKYTSAGG